MTNLDKIGTTQIFVNVTVRIVNNVAVRVNSQSDCRRTNRTSVYKNYSDSPLIPRIVPLRMNDHCASTISRVSSRMSASRVIDFRTRPGQSGELVARRTDSLGLVNL